MKTTYRVSMYLLGLFIITIGINLSIISEMGISPVSAFTYPLSKASGVSLGVITVVTYSILVLLQVVMLGRNFRPKELLQIPFSICFGSFVNLTGNILSFIQPTGYPQRFVLMLLGIVICAVGASIYMAMDIVPNAPEGFNLVVSQRFEMPFSRAKVISDVLFVAVGAAISLTAFGRVIAIREGTVLSVLLTGKLIGLFSAWWEPALKKRAFR